MAPRHGLLARLGRLATMTLGLVSAAVLAASAPIQANPAQDVTFRTTDGHVLASGQFLSNDGFFARIRTGSGPVTLAVGDLVCEGPGCSDTMPSLSIAGDLSMAQVLLPALIQRYARALGATLATDAPEDGTTRYRITAPGGNLIVNVTAMEVTQALEAQQDRRADLVMALRHPTGVTVDRLRVLALDALVPAVARENPLTALSMADLQDILGGRITAWDALGLSGGGAIDLIASPEAEAVQHPLLPEARGDRSNTPAEAAGNVSDRVAASPGAFAMVRLSRLERARALALEGACGRPVPATPARLKAEDYPLAAPLLLVLPKGRMADTAHGFLTFLASPAAQMVVRRAGFVDQLPERIRLDRQGQRLANAIAAAGTAGAPDLADLQALLTALHGAERLSITFRFDGGGTALDAQSAGNVARLADMIDSARISGGTLVLVGFSDGTGPAEANRTLSQERAETVRDALADALRTLHPEIEPVPLEVQAHGEVLPIGCDDTDWGRQMNRRVEVWMKPAAP